MILLESTFQSQINPLLLSIIGVLGLVIAFFITMYISNVSAQLKDIVAKLDLFLTRLSTVESDASKLELKIINVEKEYERCQERNCAKIFNLKTEFTKHCDGAYQRIDKLEEEQDKLDKVVIEHNHALESLRRNHIRNHPEDKIK